MFNFDQKSHQNISKIIKDFQNLLLNSSKPFKISIIFAFLIVHIVHNEGHWWRKQNGFWNLHGFQTWIHKERNALPKCEHLWYLCKSTTGSYPTRLGNGQSSFTQEKMSRYLHSWTRSRESLSLPLANVCKILAYDSSKIERNLHRGDIKFTPDTSSIQTRKRTTTSTTFNANH